MISNMVSIIVACDKNWGIGKNGKMPWRFPADFAYFKSKTLGHPMITGRKNFEDMGILPGRSTIVLTRDTEYEHEDRSVFVSHDLHDAIERAKWKEGGEEVFIVGGAEIYEAALQVGAVQTIYLTQITRTSYDCDRFFPYQYLEGFSEANRTVRYPDEKNPERLEFITYVKN